MVFSPCPLLYSSTNSSEHTDRSMGHARKTGLFSDFGEEKGNSPLFCDMSWVFTFRGPWSDGHL